MSDNVPGVVIDVPAVLWDAARDGIDCPALASVSLDAEAGAGSWLDQGDEFSLSLDRARSPAVSQDQLTGFLVFLGLALVWSTPDAESIVLRRADRPLSATYAGPAGTGSA